MLVPMLLRAALPWLTSAVKRLFQRPAPQEPEPDSYCRTIDFTHKDSSWW
jgi:hypothetical protein